MARVNIAWLAACIVVAMLLSGCSVSASPESQATRSIEVGDSGAGQTKADGAYRILGSTDGGWISKSADYDPIEQLDIAVRSAAVTLEKDPAAFESLEGTRTPSGIRTTQEWTFEDGSVLTYVSVIDEVGSRVRIDSVSVARP